MMDYDEWQKKLDKRMREIDERISSRMAEVEKRMQENMRRVDAHIAKVQKDMDRRIKSMDDRVIDYRNAEQEWTKRRVFFPKTCAETGQKIGAFQPAYFKDQWDYDRNRTREWLSEEGYTWRVLKDNV